MQFFIKEGQNPKKIENYLTMTKIAIQSIRRFMQCDIIFITNSDLDLELENVIIERRELFDYPALYQHKCKAWGLSRFDMQKIYYWGLPYSRILAIDNDTIMLKKFTEWRHTGLLASKGKYGHINTSAMLLQPSQKIFHDMYKTLQTATFSSDTGWNNCGDIGIGKWDFQAANAAQGFLSYYFMTKNEFTYFSFKQWIRHYAGRLKFTDREYIQLIHESGLPFIIPETYK